nr:MAG: DNA pilot protein [Microvirus sp.]
MITAGAVLGGATVGSNLLTGYLNYKQQKDTLEWQKDLQREIFAREDTAIARRVADLKASGLSPVLAAGQGAGTGGVVSVGTPQLDLGDSATIAMNLMKQEADISATRAQEAYTDLQRKNAETLLPAQLAMIEAQIRNADANTYNTYQNAKKAKVEANNMEKTNTSGQNIFSQMYRDTFGTVSKIFETTKKIKDDKAKGKPVKKQEIDNIINKYKSMNEGDLYLQ